MNLDEIRGFVRLASGLRPFLKATLTPGEAIESIRDGNRNRAARFLSKIEQTVFSYPASPYLRLLQAAGCELGDLHRLVKTEGVEGALERLRGAGVFMGWEELKGRKEVRRGSCSWSFREEEFNNPIIRSHYISTSSGTSVRCARFGKKYSKWFILSKTSSLSGRLRSEVVHGLIRFIGGFPAPEPASLGQLQKVADFLFDQLNAGWKPVVCTPPSAAAALALEIGKKGRSLDGVSFLLGAEPVTAARRRTIESSGARAVPTYGTSEGGWIGAQFPGDSLVDEVRIFRDAYAVIVQRDAPGPHAGPAPILVTNLRPAAPKVLINAELGDSAVLEGIDSDDAASQIGYNLRMHTIRSFRKVTAWGVTLALTDLYAVLEEDLPRGLNAAVGDFQLIEEQDEEGISGLRLIVNSSVGASDNQVKRAFIRELSKKRMYYRAMAEMVNDAGVLRIERGCPIATEAGKVLPVMMPRQSE
ncbi:MAG: hypothetical protein P8Y94_05090 [Acidobacteriota bacterium]